MMIMKRARSMSKSHEPMPEIPFELVIEILKRLPAKSLMKFKSVSKLWSSVICSRYFTNSYLRRVASSSSSSPRPRLYMCLYFLDNIKSKVLSAASPSSDDDSNNGATMSSFDAYQDLTIPAIAGCYCSGVFCGLMCFIKGESNAQIYNPTTRQLVVLPGIEESRLITEEDHKRLKTMWYVGHDPMQDQYKVVCTAAIRRNNEDAIMSEHWVFLLKEDGLSRSSWKKISCGSPPHFPLTEAILNINGRMHYLAAESIKDIVLVTFDINSEEFRTLQLPEEIFFLDIGLLEYRGKIAFLNNFKIGNDGVIELWVLENEETWGISKTLVLHPSQRHMVNGIHLKVQGTTRNGHVILVPQDHRGQHFPPDHSVEENLFNIFLYDLDKNHMRKIKIKATPNRHLTKFCDVVGMDDIENLIYL